MVRVSNQCCGQVENWIVTGWQSKYSDQALDISFGSVIKNSALQLFVLWLIKYSQYIEFLHSKQLIHRYIKHADFCIGQGYNCNKIYILDFDIAKTYPNCYFNRQNVQCHQKYKYMIETELFYGIYTHKGLEQSMRDDMESLGYLFVFLKWGTLPWNGISAANEKDLEAKIKHCKISTPISKLCNGGPKEFSEYIKCSRQLEFHQIPKYKEMRQLFRNFAYQL